jgi:thioredoxin reductase
MKGKTPLATPLGDTTIESSPYECIIVGGGPAGLSAALVLGRCRRRVLLCDNGQPRNAAAQAVHGFFSRDGTPPAELRQIARQQLCQYDTVELAEATATDAWLEGGQFRVMLDQGRLVVGRKLLLATGVVDRLPNVEGIPQFYGQTVFHCPYCDAWEFRDQPMAVYGNGKSGVGLSITVSIWTKDLVLCTDGPPRITPRDRARLETRGVVVRADRIVRLEGEDGRLQRIVFAQGEPLPRKVMFLHTDELQHCDLAGRLGCRRRPRRSRESDDSQRTNVPGLHLAGDTSRDVQFAVVAAAEGARAAFAINKALLAEELHRAGRRGHGPKTAE